MKVLLLDRAEFRAQRSTAAARVAEGITRPLVTIGENDFLWECPGCGHVYYGTLGPEPVSGWEDPVWRLTGTPEAPTLEPSLGCGQWHRGECSDGHWWLREGELVRA